MTSPGTGAELPDLFSDLHRAELTTHGEGVRYFGGVLAGGVISAASLAESGVAAGVLGSGTVPMHTRINIHPSALAAGVLTAGTASAVGPWAGTLLAGRGQVVVLDYLTDQEEPRADEPALALGELWDAAATADATALVRAVHQTFRVYAVAADTVEAPAEDDLPELERLAAAMTDVPAAVVVDRPSVPELSDDPFDNVRRLFGLTVGQLGDLFGVTERQAHRYLRDGLPDNRRGLADALVAVGLTVIGGLGADGARRWLVSGDPSPAELAAQGRTGELRERAQALRDSPAT